MTISTDSLRELHRIHRQLADLKDRLDAGPKQLRASESNITKFEIELTRTKEEFTKARVSSDDKQLQLKQREERVKDLKIKLNAASNNREYQALKEQIAADEQANSVLTDEILESYEKLDELKAMVASTDANLKKTKEELTRAKVRVQEEQVMLESELARIHGERIRVEDTLPEDFRRDFERISKVRGDKALAPVDGECCGGCFQMLTPQTMNELYMSKPVFCKSCGCLLYLSEEQGPQKGRKE